MRDIKRILVGLLGIAVGLGVCVGLAYLILYHVWWLAGPILAAILLWWAWDLGDDFVK